MVCKSHEIGRIQGGGKLVNAGSETLLHFAQNLFVGGLILAALLIRFYEVNGHAPRSEPPSSPHSMQIRISVNGKISINRKSTIVDD